MGGFLLGSRTWDKLLADAGCEARLLDVDSAGFSTGVIICTAHLAKGLEFDRVIVADASASNYHTEIWTAICSMSPVPVPCTG